MFTGYLDRMDEPRDASTLPTTAGSASARSGAERVEAELRLALPAAVRKFFASADARPGSASGLTADCAWLAYYREAAECLLRDSRANYRLSQSDLVLLASPGYHFFVVPCELCDDPPVYRFVEGESQPRLVSASFSEWSTRVFSS